MQDSQGLTEYEINSFHDNYVKSRTNLVAQRAVTTNGIFKSAEDLVAVDADGSENYTFSIDVDYEHVANQEKSGRCWMFSALNTLRHQMIKKYNLDPSFQLSQNYPFFFDKLEKSNYFYENIIKTADRPLSDRSVLFLLETPQQDGGDWCLIISLIKKYGIVPRDQMRETASSVDSQQLNTILNRKLRKDAVELRALVAKNASDEEINSARSRMLEEDYRIIAISLGVPPKEFVFEYRTKDNATFKQTGPITPKEFYKEFVDADLDNYVGLINVPTESMPFGKLYGIELSENMVGGIPNRYVNVPMEDIKAAAIKQLQDGLPCWYGCDVLKYFDLERGVMDTKLYDFDALFDTDFQMDKGDMFMYRDSLPTHAMMIGGVDIRDGKPVRWKIENSWGPDKVGKNGYMIMSDAWMDKFTYEVVINKKYLTPEQLAILDTEPTILPFWNAMNPIEGK